MMRSALNVATYFIAGSALCVAVIMFGFFVSPEAVRTSPDFKLNMLLLDQMPRR